MDLNNPVLVTTPATVPSQQRQIQQQQQQLTDRVVVQEEDVLRDVLDELDRERSRRAELEAQLRTLMEQHDVLQTSYQASLAQQSHQADTIHELQKQLAVAQTEAAAAAKQEAATQVVVEKEVPEPQKEEEKEEEKEVTRRAYWAMETQVQEYQALVNALTMGRPAIAAAAAADDPTKPLAQTKHSTTNTPSASRSLPLYVVRLLEILPWTPHAQEHVFGTEEILEWQWYDVREKQWTSQLKNFPPVLKGLPVVRPARPAEHPKDRGLLVFLAGGNKQSNNNNTTNNHHNGSHVPSKHGVLTNESMSHLWSIEDGYPLPDDGGTWEWIGGWTIEKRVAAPSSSVPSLKQRVDCDEQGWSYAQEAQYFQVNPTEWVWDNPGTEPGDKGILRKVRRRKWTRRRVLIDYPYASEQSKEYLKLLAENARLTVTSNKISDQLVETKTALTDQEELLLRAQATAATETKALQDELLLKDELLREAGIDTVQGAQQQQAQQQRHRSGSTGNNPLQEFMAKHEQMKGIGSKISQWVKSGRMGDGPNPQSNSPNPTNNNNNNNTAEPSGAGSTTTTSEDRTDETVSSPDRESSSNKNNKDTTSRRSQSPKPGGFDWKKVGRGTFLDKLKGHHHGDKSPAHETHKPTPTRHSPEGSFTDESVDDTIEIQEEA